jgi:RNA polymerase sigma-70 factor (ECF subfamily)
MSPPARTRRDKVSGLETLIVVPSRAEARLPSQEEVSPSSTPQANAAFEKLVELHGLRVWRSLRYLGVQESELPDASQDVLLIAYRKYPEFRGDAQVGTWLYGICLGVSRNLRRKRRRAGGVPLELPEPSVDATQEAEVDRQRLRERLRSALDLIQPEQREVFVLREIEELDMRSIARAAGCPLFTAYSRLRLARRHLARLLETPGSDRP